MWEKIQGWLKEREYSVTSEELVEKARNRSDNARLVFYDVLNELEEANKELAVAVDCDTRIIRELELNIENANNQEQQNQDMIEKLQYIVGGHNGQFN